MSHLTTFLMKAPSWVLILVPMVFIMLTLLNFVVLAQYAGDVHNQAKAGAAARVQQCRLAPVTDKIYMDLLDRGIITAKDFATYKDLAGRFCPNGH